MVKIDPDKPLYTIGVVAEIIGVDPRVLRTYEDGEIITPSRSDSNRRLYSQKDIDKLIYVHYLTHVKKVNLAGVSVIIDLLDKMDSAAKGSIMSEVEEDITKLRGETKKLYVEGKEELEEDILKQAGKIDKLKKKKD